MCRTFRPPNNAAYAPIDARGRPPPRFGGSRTGPTCGKPQHPTGSLLDYGGRPDPTGSAPADGGMSGHAVHQGHGGRRPPPGGHLAARRRTAGRATAHGAAPAIGAVDPGAGPVDPLDLRTRHAAARPESGRGRRARRCRPVPGAGAGRRRPRRTSTTWRRPPRTSSSVTSRRGTARPAGRGSLCFSASCWRSGWRWLPSRTARLPSVVRWPSPCSPWWSPAWSPRRRRVSSPGFWRCRPAAVAALNIAGDITGQSGAAGAVAAAAALALLGAVRRHPGLIAGGLTALVGTATTWIALVAGAPADRTAGLVLLVAVIAAGLAGQLALGGAGLVNLMVADEQDGRVPRAAVRTAVRRGQAIATAVVWAASVLAGTACAVLLFATSSATVAWVTPALGGLGGLIFTLRSRMFTRARQIGPMLGVGVTTAAAAAVAAPGWWGLDGSRRPASPSGCSPRSPPWSPPPASRLYLMCLPPDCDGSGNALRSSPCSRSFPG